MRQKMILLLSAGFLLACSVSRSAFLTQPNPIPSPTFAQVESPTTQPTHPQPTHPQPTHPQPTQQNVCTVSAESFLHVRETAGIDGVVIGWLAVGHVVIILNDPPVGDWIHIQSDDLTGWINSNYCTEAP